MKSMTQYNLNVRLNHLHTFSGIQWTPVVRTLSGTREECTTYTAVKFAV